MRHVSCGISLLHRRQRNDEMSFAVLDYILNAYIVMVLYHNEIHYIKSFTLLADAEAMTISLANKWYREDGIKAFGLSRIRTMDKMRDYYGSDEYHNSNDAANICIKHIKLEDSLL